ncbi:MAG: hypothetical protein ACK46X_00145 [Candidatus Sericytochromatia bacterium]
MKTISALLAAGLVLASALAGCGASPAAPAKQLRKTPVQQGANPTINQAMPGVPGMVDPQIKQLLAAVAATNQRAAGFTAVIDVQDKGPSESGSQTLKVSFKKPNSLKIDIMKDSAGNDGVKALWAGASQMQVKPKFPPITVSLDVSDKRLISRNGWTIKDTGVSAIVGVLLNPQSQFKALGDQPVGGKTLAMLEVRCPTSPKGATHEVIGIDRQTNLPGYRAVYRGQTLMYKLEMKSMKLTAPSATEMAI